MATLAAQIESLAGTDTGSESAQWMTDGAREIINLLPDKLKMKCATVTTLNNSTLVMDLDSAGDIIFVSRLSANSGGYHTACREIPSMYGGLAEDSTNLMFYATATDPVYWIDANTSGSDGKSGTLYVKPNPEATQIANVHHVNYPVFTTGDTETYDIEQKSIIANFPDEAEYLVVLYAAIKVLQNKMNEKSGDLPSDIPELILSNASESLPTFTSPSDIVLPVAPIAPIMSEKSVTISGDAPVYIKPTITLDTKPTINDLTITSVPPVIPSLSDSSVSFSSITAPVYNTQSVAPDFADAENWLNTEEDSELVASRVQIISTQLQEYQLDIQNELNNFNKLNTEYQALVQKAIKDAELSSSDDSQKIQKYSSELQSYQADISKQVQEYQQNLQKEIQLWKTNNSNNLQKYAQDIQNELNLFNDANVEYQAKLQKDLQDAQLAESKEGRDLQKYASELSSYQAEVGAKVQEFQSILQNDLEKFKTDMEKYNADIAKINSDNQNKIGKYSQDMANYAAKIQKHSTDYQWIQGQYAQLKQDYNQGIQLLVAGGLPQPQQQQGER